MAAGNLSAMTRIAGTREGCVLARALSLSGGSDDRQGRGLLSLLASPLPCLNLVPIR